MRNAHTLITTITGSKNSQKGVNSQVDYQNHNALGPQRSLLYRCKDSIEFKCKKHTFSNQQAQEKSETVNLTENVPKTLSKAPCLVAKRMSLTLHLLLFKQSM